MCSQMPSPSRVGHFNRTALPASETAPHEDRLTFCQFLVRHVHTEGDVCGIGIGRTRLAWARVEARFVHVVVRVKRRDAIAAVVATRAFHVFFVAIPRVAVDDLEFVSAWLHFHSHAPRAVAVVAQWRSGGIPSLERTGEVNAVFEHRCHDAHVDVERHSQGLDAGLAGVEQYALPPRSLRARCRWRRGPARGCPCRRPHATSMSSLGSVQSLPLMNLNTIWSALSASND